MFKNKISTGRISLHLVIFLVWWAYIIFYNIISNKCEAYFYTYILVNFIITFCFICFFRTNKLQPIILYIPILFLGVSESIVSILQYLHVLNSNSLNFVVTGTMDNPNIAAMIICLSIPSLIDISLNLKPIFRLFSLIVWLLIIASLIVLQCRTALLGTFLITCIYVLKLVKDNSIFKSLYSKIVFALFFLILIGFFSIFQYQKKTSSDGRLTIWKISTKMIAKKPIEGYGYGQFQREYNLEQANYFNSKSRSEPERMNAGFTAMAYNEYLQQSVMGGLFGGILFTAVIISLLYAGWKRINSHYAPFAGITAFAAMSFFNFTVEVPAIFFMFCVYAALLLSTGWSEKKIIVFRTYKLIALVSLLLYVVFLFLNLKKYEAQKELAHTKRLIQSGQIKQAGQILHEIEPNISTSEAYYRTKATYFILNQDYANAQKATIQALNYTSTPNTLLDAAMLSEKLGNFIQSEYYYRLVCGIEPHMLRPRVMQMEMYMRSGQIAKMQIIANEILLMKPKFMSERVQTYKQLALKRLNDTYKTINNKQL